MQPKTVEDFFAGATEVQPPIGARYNMEMLPLTKCLCLISDVQIISTRENFSEAHGLLPEEFTAEHNHAAKALVLESLYQTNCSFLLTRSLNVISIGDMPTDLCATQLLAQQVDSSSIIKFVQLPHAPSFCQVLHYMELLSKSLVSVFSHPASIIWEPGAEASMSTSAVDNLDFGSVRAMPHKSFDAGLKMQSPT